MSWVRRNVGSLDQPGTGWPCQAPAWGELFAIDANTGDVAWRMPLGCVDALEALGIMNTGSNNMGGSVATAGGVGLIAASSDAGFHAYESKTGKLTGTRPSSLKRAPQNPREIKPAGSFGPRILAGDFAYPSAPQVSFRECLGLRSQRVRARR